VPCPRTQQTNLLAYLHTIPLMLNVKQGSGEYQLLKYFGPTQPENRTQVNRIRGERSNHVLSNRKQYTKTNCCKSNLAEVTYGVPYGSSLGSLLFLLYINDIPQTIQFNITLYADDTYLMLLILTNLKKE